MLGAAIRAFAQQATFSTEVRVVTLLATVHDGGSIVTNLNKEDFHVEEETIGLLVDTSRSQIGVLERERSANHTFLDRVLRGDKDRAFVAARRCSTGRFASARRIR